MPDREKLREQIARIIYKAHAKAEPHENIWHWLEIGQHQKAIYLEHADAILSLLQPEPQDGLRKALEKITAIEHEQDPVHDEYGFDTCHVEGYNNGLSECQDIARQALSTVSPWREDMETCPRDWPLDVWAPGMKGPMIGVLSAFEDGSTQWKILDAGFGHEDGPQWQVPLFEITHWAKRLMPPQPPSTKESE